MSVGWDSMSFCPWRGRICLATFLHWGGFKSASLSSCCLEIAIPGRSLRGIWTTSSTTSKCLRWPSTWSSLIPRAAGVHWHGGAHLSNGRNLLQRGLQGSHEPGLNQKDANINCMYFRADHSYRRDARVNDDEERCHFGLLPSFPSTWEVLQETCAWKEKGLFLSQSL